MSTFSYTDWTVICNGRDGDQACMEQGRTDIFDLQDGSTAADVRKILKREGWVVNVPNPDRESRIRRLDFCPKHKPEGY